MIQEDYISFEIAKLLKEKGFDENTPVNYFVGDNKPRGCVVGEMIYHKRAEKDTHLIACPTLQMVMKWLREVHKVYIDIHTYFDEEPVEYNAICYKDGIYNDTLYYTTEYEDAINNAIKYALENLI